jgi:ribA/ribD-fused uncharacterized protein
MKKSPKKIQKENPDMDEIPRLEPSYYAGFLKELTEIHIDEIISSSKSNEDMMSIITFWRPTDQYGWLGQWYRSEFMLTKEIIKQFPREIKKMDLFVKRFDVLEKLSEQETFSTAEKFMMMGKAALFRDKITFDTMANTDSPMTQKHLGQKVKKFDENIWKLYCRDIVKIGNYLKFSQDDELKEKLVNTNDTILVEGSPLDRIWGVGLRFDDSRIRDKSKWKGLNYLGECLMFVRDLLKG